MSGRQPAVAAEVRALVAAAGRAGTLDTMTRAAREQLYTAIRAAVVGGMTKAEASRRTGVSRVTIDKILKDRSRV